MQSPRASSTSNTPGKADKEQEGDQKVSVPLPTVVTEKDQRWLFYRNLRHSLLPPSDAKETTDGTFAACEGVRISEAFDLKSFHVEGAGELQLPLSAEDASKLLSVCEQAPFGKGLSTVVDTSVRRCWQVDASKVTFPGTPTFLSDTMQTLATEAVHALGPDGAGAQVEAHLYKLLFYEAGGHFKFHRDTEKEDGMFASLILQLPTGDGYTGGELVVKHNKKEREFDCHVFSETAFYYTVFFADCLHKLRKVKSGTRLCLAFNLVKRKASVDPVHELFEADKLQKVEAALRPWLEEVAEKKVHVIGTKLAIPLRHKYTEGSLCFAWLKGGDGIMVELLKECKDNSGERWLDLHLCLVTKRQAQGAGYFEEDILLTSVIGLADEHPSVPVKLRIDMQKDVFVTERARMKGRPFDSEPDVEELEDYAGNEGPDIHRLYHKAMLVVSPKALSITVTCEASVSHALSRLEKRLDTSDPNLREQFHRVIRYCERNIEKVWGLQEDEITPRLLSLCIKVGAPADVLSILQLLAKEFESENPRDGKRRSIKVGVRTAKVAEAIATAVKVLGWELVSSAIIALVKACALDQGDSFAELAKQLICLGNMDAGAVVAKTASGVFEARIAVLESHKMPEFSWCQPQAKFPESAEIENFLRGPEEKYVYESSPGKPDPTEFRYRKFGSHGYEIPHGYSAIATEGGEGGGAFLVIKKTRQWFDATMDQWRKVQDEIQLLKPVLEKILSVVPASNAAAVTLPDGSTQPDGKKQRLDTRADAEVANAEVADDKPEALKGPSRSEDIEQKSNPRNDEIQ